MSTFYFGILVLVVFCQCSMIKIKQWTTGQAHSDQINAIAIYNDNSKFVTCSKDNTVKIWSVQTFLLLHTEPLGDDVTHISLHPVDNRIFILDYLGTLKVLNPYTYATLHSSTYHTTAGNYIQFFDNNNKFVVGGYDSGTVNPALQIYNANTYAWIRSGTTTSFGVG